MPSPADGRTFRLGDLVALRGTASDLNDGIVKDLSWASADHRRRPPAP